MFATNAVRRAGASARLSLVAAQEDLMDTAPSTAPASTQPDRLRWVVAAVVLAANVMDLLDATTSTSPPGRPPRPRRRGQHHPVAERRLHPGLRGAADRQRAARGHPRPPAAVPRRLVRVHPVLGRLLGRADRRRAHRLPGAARRLRRAHDPQGFGLRRLARLGPSASSRRASSCSWSSCATSDATAAAR